MLKSYHLYIMLGHLILFGIQHIYKFNLLEMNVLSLLLLFIMFVVV